MKVEIGIDPMRINQYQKWLTNPCVADYLSENETITYTVNFGDGMEADIKICGVQWVDGEDNSAWTEMVLFKNGAEIACSEPCTEILGLWSLEYDGVVYEVLVQPARNHY